MSDDELLSAYLDGDLTPADRARVEGLLASREDWREIYEDLVALRGELSALPRVAAPVGLSVRILEAIAAQQATSLQQAISAPPAVSAAMPIATPAAAGHWLSPVVGLAAAGALAASLALALAAPQWFRPSGESDVAHHTPAAAAKAPTEHTEIAATPVASPAPEAPSRNRQVELPAPVAPPPFTEGLAKNSPAPRGIAPGNAPRDVGPGFAPRGPVPGDALPNDALTNKAAAGAPAPALAAIREKRVPDAKGGAPVANAPGSLRAGVEEQANDKEDRPGGKPRAEAVHRRKEKKEDALTRRAFQTIDARDGQSVTVIEIDLPPEMTAEQAIARLVAAGDVALTTDAERLREAAAGFYRDAKPADRNLNGPRGDVLVMDLDAGRAEHVLAAIEPWKREAEALQEKAKAESARFAAPLAKLETDLDAAPAAPGAPLGDVGGPAAAEKRIAAKPGSAGPPWAVVLPREEVARPHRKQARLAVDEGGAGQAGGAGPEPKFQAASGDGAFAPHAPSAGAPAAAAAAKSFDKGATPPRRRLVILFHPAADRK